MILITGANGQLGREFQRLFERMGLDYLPTHHKARNGCTALDITDHDAVRQVVESYPKLSFIINCAAYNAVDRAESEPDRAFAVNRNAVRNLAEAACQVDAVFITFSTDYVFGGNNQKPYTEEDQPNPLNLYGQSKFQGERESLDAWDKGFVIRTSWVYGTRNSNFSKSLLH